MYFTPRARLIARKTTRREPATKTGASLSFELLRVERPGPDFFGVFKLTVPNALLQAANADAKTATLSVRSLGEKSRRWFGLFEYRGVAVK